MYLYSNPFFMDSCHLYLSISLMQIISGFPKESSSPRWNNVSSRPTFLIQRILELQACGNICESLIKRWEFICRCRKCCSHVLPDVPHAHRHYISGMGFPKITTPPAFFPWQDIHSQQACCIIAAPDLGISLPAFVTLGGGHYCYIFRMGSILLGIPCLYEFIAPGACIIRTTNLLSSMPWLKNKEFIDNGKILHFFHKSRRSCCQQRLCSIGSDKAARFSFPNDPTEKAFWMLEQSVLFISSSTASLPWGQYRYAPSPFSGRISYYLHRSS